MQDDTIYALSSGRPPAAVAVVRISGPRAHDAARALAGRLPEPRRASLRLLKDPATSEPLDEALVLRFDGPASATGEDVVELHCHGGRAVTDALLAALGRLAGLREAQPGEFTRRAFENERIDLTEAEGLADLIEAETESQRRAALLLAEGGLRLRAEEWRQRLVDLSARAERAIDYAEEEGETRDAHLSSECDALALEVKEWLSRPRAEPLKDGVRVVVAGPPNAGKSSLINALVGSDKVIVTDVPGTTRDRIDIPLSLDGVPITLVDTAGLRDTSDAVETIGVARARNAVALADVLLWLGKASEAPPHPRRILIHAKCDLEPEPPWGDSLAVSAVTGAGLGGLSAAIRASAASLLPADDQIALNRRQAEHLEEARASLADAASTSDPVLIAEHLRLARGAFDRLTGRAGVDDVLDALFGRFCLGK